MSAADLQRLRDLLETRRSVRAFKPEPPTRADIEAVLEQAVLAPSASNKQPWRFLIVTDKTTIAAMAAAVREAIQTIRRHIPPASEEACLAYGTQVVAGVTPGRAGQKFEDKVPIFDTVEDAVKQTGAEVSVIFVPPPGAADAICEAAAAGIRLVV